MSEQQAPKFIWPSLNYRDAHAAIAFLVDAFGFGQTAVHDDDQGRVAHAELRWPEGGGVMLGDASREESEFSRMPTGCASVYVVTDDPDGVHERAIAAGADPVRGFARRGLRITASASVTPRATSGASGRTAARDARRWCMPRRM